MGELTSDDPDEEARQKKYKAVLNKLTPENFDRMFEQVRRVKAILFTTINCFVLYFLFLSCRTFWCADQFPIKIVLGLVY